MPFQEERRRVKLGGDPVGVVDIGSNSVRLIVYESLTRSPVPVFNEKAMCGIGRGLVNTGKLNEQGMQGAYDALCRFRVILESVKGVSVFAVATAAVRDAENGSLFVKKAGQLLGQKVCCPPFQMRGELWVIWAGAAWSFAKWPMAPSDGA